MGRHKHCAWGTCKSDSDYPDKLEPGVIFIPFPKPGHTRDFVRPGVPMTELNKKAEAEKNAKAKRWLHLCGRKHFNSLDQIKNHTYVCSLHFRSRSGPTKEDPDPILATLTDEQQETRLKRKRKAAKDRSEQIKHRKVVQHSSTSGTNTASEFEQTETVHSPVAENLPEDLHSHKNEMGTQTEHGNWQVRARLDATIMRNQLKKFHGDEGAECQRAFVKDIKACWSSRSAMSPEAKVDQLMTHLGNGLGLSCDCARRRRRKIQTT